MVQGNTDFNYGYFRGQVYISHTPICSYNPPLMIFTLSGIIYYIYFFKVGTLYMTKKPISNYQSTFNSLASLFFDLQQNPPLSKQDADFACKLYSLCEDFVAEFSTSHFRSLISPEPDSFEF